MKRLVLLGLVAGLAASIRYLPWWASTGLIVLTPVLGWLLVKRFFKQFFLGAFKAKSAVLKGARACVHSIQPAPPFKPEYDDDEDLFEPEEPHHWVYIDLDIAVDENPDSPMSFWEPSELAIVADGAVADDFESDEAVGEIYAVEMMENGAWVSVDDKVAGSQRLRLHVAARQGVDRFLLRYYFELLKNAG